MGDTNPTMVKVIAAFITLLAELNDALTEAIASEEPRVAPKRTEEVEVVFTPPLSEEEEEEGWHSAEWSFAVDEHQKRLDDFDIKNPVFEKHYLNRDLYRCGACGLTGHTRANHSRPCRRLKEFGL